MKLLQEWFKENYFEPIRDENHEWIKSEKYGKTYAYESGKFTIVVPDDYYLFAFLILCRNFIDDKEKEVEARNEKYSWSKQ